MWKITTLLCVLLGATIPLSFVDGSLAAGLLGLAASLLLCATLLIVPAGELAFLQRTTCTCLLIATMLPIWFVIQLLPAASFANPAWRAASDSLGIPIVGRISIDLEATIQALINYLALCCVVLVAAASAIDRRRAHRITIGLAATAIAGVIVATVRLHLIDHVQDPTAALAGSLVVSAITGGVVCLASAIEAWEAARARSRRTSPSTETWWFAAGAMLIAVLCLVSGEAELLLFTSLAMCVVLFVWICRRLAASPATTAILAAGLLAIGAATAVASIPDRTIPSVIAFASATSDQIAVAQAMLGDVPRSGIGAGAATSLLPTYTTLRDPAMNEVPLTSAAALWTGVGPVFFWLSVALLAGMFVTLVACAVRRGRDWSFSAASAGSILGLIVMAFRSSFSLSTPTVSLLATLLGAGLAQSIARSRTDVI